jgi:hypothetical protein
VNQSVKKLIKDLVIKDEREESLEIGDDDDEEDDNRQGHQSRTLSRHHPSSFNNDREDGNSTPLPRTMHEAYQHTNTLTPVLGSYACGPR